MSTGDLLRPEARPFGRLTLDREQNEAVQRILRMLNSAIEMIDRSSTRKGGNAARSTIWEVDPERSSRIVLLSGERGTGKTTVLLSMMKDCRDIGEHKREVERAGPKLPGKGDPEFLEKVAQRTIWLEPLDMETLPTTTNLLAAILARVENVARMFHIEREYEADRRRSLIEKERENDPLNTLRRL
jgi:hypothetical protein